MQTQITADVNNLANNYFNKTEVNEIKTNLQNQITADVTNLSTNYYNKTHIDGAFSNLIDSAPEALNTLKELAVALNNDANYATTIPTQLSNKQHKFMLGEIPSNTSRLFDSSNTKFRAIHCSNPYAYVTIDADVYSKSYIDTSLANQVSYLTDEF